MTVERNKITPFFEETGREIAGMDYIYRTLERLQFFDECFPTGPLSGQWSFFLKKSKYCLVIRKESTYLCIRF